MSQRTPCLNHKVKEVLALVQLLRWCATVDYCCDSAVSAPRHLVTSSWRSQLVGYTSICYIASSINLIKLTPATPIIILLFLRPGDQFDCSIWENWAANRSTYLSAIRKFYVSAVTVGYGLLGQKCSIPLRFNPNDASPQSTARYLCWQKLVAHSALAVHTWKHSFLLVRAPEFSVVSS
jgi:hypothetical protein